MDGWMDGYQKSITRQILTKEKRKERIVTFGFLFFLFHFQHQLFSLPQQVQQVTSTASSSFSLTISDRSKQKNTSARKRKKEKNTRPPIHTSVRPVRLVLEDKPTEPF